MYGEWLALHQVLVGKLCYTCHSGVHLKRILFELGLAVTEINTKKG